MEVTRKQVLEIHSVLDNLSKKDMKPKGAYAISKNKRISDSEIKHIQEAQQKMVFPEGFNKFEAGRVKLCEEYSNKNEAGEPIKIGQRYDIPLEKMKEFEEAVQALQGEHKEDLEERDKVVQEFQDLLDEAIEVDFHLMKLEWLPDTISGSQMDILMDLIDEG